jgi:hypothetical protein
MFLFVFLSHIRKHLIHIRVLMLQDNEKAFWFDDWKRERQKVLKMTLSLP